MTTPVVDFGRYLQSVEERDIDLLLMEEFHVEPPFAVWFAERVGLGPAAVFDGAWHSLSDQDGETDLLLRVCIGVERVAVLIENKVAAPEQEAQDLRYHLRGMRSQEAGRYDRFVTVMCAPQVYLDGLAADSAYQHRVSYEAVLEWYTGQEGPRAAWRRAILSEAIQQGRRGYVMKVHAGHTDFHRAYWEHLQAHHPEFTMRRPAAKGPKSTWMYFRTQSLPKNATLIHKNEQACVDLQFERTAATALERQRRADWPQGVRVVSRGAAAAMSISVQRCDMDRPLREQIAKVESALAAALELARCAGAVEAPA